MPMDRRRSVSRALGVHSAKPGSILLSLAMLGLSLTHLESQATLACGDPLHYHDGAIRERLPVESNIQGAKGRILTRPLVLCDGTVGDVSMWSIGTCQ